MTVGKAHHTILEHGLLPHPHYVDAGHMTRVAGVPRGYCFTCQKQHDSFVEIKEGAIRYKRDDDFIVTPPGDPHYSTAIFCAEDVWLNGRWEKYA